MPRAAAMVPLVALLILRLPVGWGRAGTGTRAWRVGVAVTWAGSGSGSTEIEVVCTLGLKPSGGSNGCGAVTVLTAESGAVGTEEVSTAGGAGSAGAGCSGGVAAGVSTGGDSTGGVSIGGGGTCCTCTWAVAWAAGRASTDVGVAAGTAVTGAPATGTGSEPGMIRRGRLGAFAGWAVPMLMVGLGFLSFWRNIESDSRADSGRSCG